MTEIGVPGPPPGPGGGPGCEALRERPTPYSQKSILCRLFTFFDVFVGWVPGGSLAGFLLGRKSVILGVWAAPGARESLQKCGRPGVGTMRKLQNIKIAQNLCLEGVWGPRLRNKSVQNVWGLRPHTFVSLLLCNLGPRTPLRTQFLRNFNILYFPHCTWGRTTTTAIHRRGPRVYPGSRVPGLSWAA